MSGERPSFRLLGRIFFCPLVLLALLAAALLSAAPAWHEQLHHGTANNHLCAVSFFTSGHCEAAAATCPNLIPGHTRLLATFIFPPALALPRAHFFARLEHAPPALA